VKVILAWLLALDDFEAIGSALLLSDFAQATSRTGVVASLIQCLIDSGWNVRLALFSCGSIEVDSIADLQVYEPQKHMFADIFLIK